jgi:hypothetical protein
MSAAQSNKTVSQTLRSTRISREKEKDVCKTIKDHERIATNNQIPNTKEH